MSSTGPQPYLPEAEVAPAVPGAKSNTKRTLGLWVVLIVMFLAIWQLLAPGPSPRPTLPPCESTFSWGQAAITFTPLLLLVVLLRWFMRTYGQSTDFSLALEPGRLAMAERRFLDAAAIFRRVADDHKKRPPYAASALQEVAVAELWAGRYDEAIAAFTFVERAKGVLRASNLRT